MKCDISNEIRLAACAAVAALIIGCLLGAGITAVNYTNQSEFDKGYYIGYASVIQGNFEYLSFLPSDISTVSKNYIRGLFVGGTEGARDKELGQYKCDPNQIVPHDNPDLFTDKRRYR